MQKKLAHHIHIPIALFFVFCGVLSLSGSIYMARAAGDPPPANPDPNPGIPADAVLGQGSFVAGTANRGGSVTSQTLSQPYDIFVSASQTFVVDRTNSRILIWNSAAPTDGSAADIVLGQVNMTSSETNVVGSPSSTSLSFPSSVYSDGSKIYVADQGNYRVLIWNTTSPTTNQAADIVLGQPNFTTANNSTVASTTLGTVNGVFSNGSQIFVADNGNNRVLVWNTTSPANGAPADIVLGQANFTAGEANRGGASPAANTVSSPNGVYADSSRIYVADSNNRRVLIWNSLTPTSGSAADAVIGQTDFVTATDGTTNAKFGQVADVFSDGYNIFAADDTNNRIMIWNTTSPANGAVATAVVGHRSFNVSTAYDVSSTTLSTPTGVSYRNGKVYVADSGFNRTLRFDMTPATSSAPTLSSAGAASLSVAVNPATNPEMTQFAIYSTRTGNYVAADGTLTSSPVWQTTSTWGSSVSVTGLSASTQYSFLTVGRYITGWSSPSSSVANLYTLANQSTTPTVTVSTTSRLNITVNTNSNPTSTTYAVYNATTDYYLDVNGAETLTPTFSATSTLGSTFAATGLATNTAYQFVTIARNGDGVNAATSTASTAVYTLASAPTNLAASGSTETTITMTWSGDGTTHYIENTTNGVNSGWITGSSRTFTDLVCGTTYTFRVKGRNGDAVETAFSSSVSASTSPCSGRAAPPAAAAPTLPSDTPDTETPGEKTADTTTAEQTVIVPVPATEQKKSFEIAEPTPVSIGGGSHTVTVIQATAESINLIIQSDPISVTLLKGQEKDVDTDKDGVVDTRVRYDGLADGKPLVTFAQLARVKKAVEPVLINDGADETNSANVVLTFHATGATEVAVSNREDFVKASYVKYKPTMNWTLTAGDGTKVVYVRFRSAKGGVVTAKNSIVLNTKKSAPVAKVMPLVKGAPPARTPVVPAPVNASQSAQPPSGKFDRPLQYYSRGNDVAALQQFLRERGYFTFRANTGFYGPITRAAVRQFQKDNNIPSVGRVGPMTRAALNALLDSGSEE